jgi:hypothetical protein
MKEFHNGGQSLPRGGMIDVQPAGCVTGRGHNAGIQSYKPEEISE